MLPKFSLSCFICPVSVWHQVEDGTQATPYENNDFFLKRHRFLEHALGTGWGTFQPREVDKLCFMLSGHMPPFLGLRHLQEYRNKTAVVSFCAKQQWLVGRGSQVPGKAVANSCLSLYHSGFVWRVKKVFRYFEPRGPLWHSWVFSPFTET